MSRYAQRGHSEKRSSLERLMLNGSPEVESKGLALLLLNVLAATALVIRGPGSRHTGGSARARAPPPPRPRDPLRARGGAVTGRAAFALKGAGRRRWCRSR